MSEPDGNAPRERAWVFYVDDMIRFAEAVRTYTAGLDLPGFQHDRRTYDATLRNLELIGEAASRVPPPIRDGADAIPWRQLVATRNRLIHGYLGIDDDTIWSIVRDDVPDLLHALRVLRADIGVPPAGGA